MNVPVKMIRGKVVLIKLYDGKCWDYCSCGNHTDVEIGKTLWVGSISSRDGYRTSGIVKIEDCKNIPDAIYLETESGSRYLLAPIDHYYATSLGE